MTILKTTAIKDQVCSFEQAKKLYDLGVRLPHLFLWSQKIDTPSKIRVDWIFEKPQLYYKPEADPQWREYPTYTNSEIAMIVPWEIDIVIFGVRNFYYFKIEKFPKGEWRTMYEAMRSNLNRAHKDINQNLAIALTDTLLWLIDEKYVTIEQINSRIDL